MTRESISTIFIIVFLSTLLVLSTRSVMIQPVFGKNNDIGQMSTEDYSCRYQALQIGSLCQAEKSNIQSYDTNAREHKSNFGDPEARMNTFMKHYDEYQAEELGTYGFDQNDSVSNRGNTNSNESVTPTLAGHNGGSPGGGNHNGGSPGGGNHNGNNDQNDKSNGDRGASSCTPVTLSDLPGQTRPLAICLVTGKDTNVATEIGFATFTLVQLNGEEFQLTINGLNGQTQPAIVTVASGATSPITVPGLGTGNVLIGNAYSVILDVPRMSSLGAKILSSY